MLAAASSGQFLRERGRGEWGWGTSTLFVFVKSAFYNSLFFNRNLEYFSAPAVIGIKWSPPTPSSLMSILMPGYHASQPPVLLNMLKCSFDEVTPLIKIKIYQY